MDKIKRSELKFFFPLELLSDFRCTVRRFLEDDAHNRTVDNACGYLVRSLYFESYLARCYEDKMAGLSERSKLRIRTYPLSKNADVYLLELKRKIEDVILKDRAAISKTDVCDLIGGRHSNVIERNPHDDVVRDFICEKIAKELHFGLVVDYHREAFVNRAKTRYIRANIDTDIRYYPAQRFFDTRPFGGRRFFAGDYAVCEFKFEDRVPFWMAALIERYRLQLTPISKFSTGVEKLW